MVEPPGTSVGTEPFRTTSSQGDQSVYDTCTYTYTASSALKWFQKVRGSSLRFNHLELVYMYPPPLVPTMKMWFEKVWNS